MAATAILIAGCGKKASAAPSPARGEGGGRAAEGRAHLHRGHRPDAGIDRDRGAGPRRGLPPDGRLQGGHARPQGAAALHDRPAALRGALAQAKGALAQAEADLARAQQDVARYEPLVAQNAIPRQIYETAVAVERAAEAARGGGHGRSAAGARSTSATRRSSLPRTAWSARPRSTPARSSGRGQSTLLTRISQIDVDPRPLHHSRAGLPATRAPARRARCGHAATATTAASSWCSPTATCIPQPGKLVFVDRNVDPETGTILAEAAFPNPGLHRAAGAVRPRAGGRGH